MVSRLNPMFIDVTWGAHTQNKSFLVASHVQRYCGVDVLLHLTCTEMTHGRMTEILNQCKYCGINNILVLRGDSNGSPPIKQGQTQWNPSGETEDSNKTFQYAIDLVRFVRERHGNYFSIAVAGHPEGRVRGPSFTTRTNLDVIEDEITYLKEKIDAGADYIITQFFYDVQAFISYVKKCRSYGITCPIIPGVMPIQNFSTFIRMTEFCGIHVPKTIMDLLLPVKDDDDAVKEIGCKISVDLCRSIVNAQLPEVEGFHFYTLNLERSVTRILDSMKTVVEPPVLAVDDWRSKISSPISESGGMIDKALIMPSQRPLPWRPSTMDKRAKEEIRPINWANRPKSYVARTDDWDEYPNGRWGDATSPAFGELSDLAHYYGYSFGSEDERREMLSIKTGSPPLQLCDIYEVFARYIEGKIPNLPWCESSLQPESFTIQAELAELNRKGFLTINSQPAVNGVPSDNPQFGWGGPNGFVYQKAYCECFVSPENAQKLVQMVTNNPSMNLYAVNASGEDFKSGVNEGGVTAVTWGVFPNREILQPTIFDPSAFLVWAEEAFSLWTSMWQNLYDVDSPSWELVNNIQSTFFLVALIDNDYLRRDSLFDALLHLERSE
mmetsp:Transcript_13554/g.19441  ORF Transcript_13554/g.19441 Transcript_13554/m.19441 type:complete len:609 (+) Transcript_13554:143-1969(+)